LTGKNYRELTELHKRLTAEGAAFEIVAFPCNQFGGQEPGTAADIRARADSYDVKFVIASKVDVNGSSAHPLFQYATAALPGLCGTTSVKWNFTKFLFDSTGAPVKRYAPTDSPFSFESEIRELLARTKTGSADGANPKNKMQ
jgi:glutathione peroxidase